MPTLSAKRRESAFLALAFVSSFPFPFLARNKRTIDRTKSRVREHEDLSYHLASPFPAVIGEKENDPSAVERAAPIIDPRSVPIIWRNLINATLAFVVRAPGRATIITDSLIVSGQCVMTMHLVHRQCTSARSSVMQIADVECLACPPRYRPSSLLYCGKQCVVAHTRWILGNSRLPLIRVLQTRLRSKADIPMSEDRSISRKFSAAPKRGAVTFEVISYSWFENEIKDQR